MVLQQQPGDFLPMDNGHYGIALSTIGLVGIEQHPERAAWLLGASEPYVEASLQWPFYLADFDRSRKAARERLDEADFNLAWIKGQTMNLNQAIAFILEEG